MLDQGAVLLLGLVLFGLQGRQQLLLSPLRRIILRFKPPQDRLGLGPELLAQPLDTFPEADHLGVLGLVGLDQLLVLCLTLENFVLERGRVLILEHVGEQLEVETPGLGEEDLFLHPLGPRLEQGIREPRQMLRGQVLLRAGKQHDVLFPKELGQPELRRLQLLPGLFQLLGKELAGVPAGRQSLLEVERHVAIGDRVRHPGGQARRVAVE